MGIADRDYSRDSSRGQAASLEMMSVTMWLIIINVAVYLINLISPAGASGLRAYGLLYYWGHFSADTVIYQFQLWRFITFQFLHQNLEHIIFNMLALYIFGPMIEEYLGRRRYLAFYLLCGIAGAAMYLILWRIGVLRSDVSQFGALADAQTPMVGASAGIFGVLLAGAYVAPDATVMLLFPPIPIRLRVLAWILIGIAVYTVLKSGQNAGGQAAHLGGAAMGALLIRKPQFLSVFALTGRGRFR